MRFFKTKLATHQTVISLKKLIGSDIVACHATNTIEISFPSYPKEVLNYSSEQDMISEAKSLVEFIV